MFGIELLVRVSRGQADLHSVLLSFAIVHVPENLFEYGSLCVDVQEINYRQRISRVLSRSWQPANSAACQDESSRLLWQ